MRPWILVLLLAAGGCGTEAPLMGPTPALVNKPPPDWIAVDRWDGSRDPCDWPSLLPIPGC